MLTYKQNVIIILATMILSMVFVAILNRIWPREKRVAHNDLIGWQLGILGTTYAVILGFMLYTVWTNFVDGTLNVDIEANALRNLYVLAEGLPEPQRAALKKECQDYAGAVINHDWHDMAHGRTPEESNNINRSMWKTLMSVNSITPSQSVAEDHAIEQLTSLTQHRRTRLLQSSYILPHIFWAVLLVGGLVTIASASLFGSANRALHTLQVFFFTVFITLVLLAIADVNLPFRGWVHVSNYAFVRAQENMQN